MSEYGEPISPDQIARAVATALELRRTAPGRPLEDCVREAVARTICGCVLGIEDELEQRLSGTHAGVLAEVGREAEACLADERLRAANDLIDEASEESFPASDPPGWIWQRPESP